MSKRTYTFTLDYETIIITHNKRYHKKHQYFTEELEFYRIPNSSDEARSETVLDSGYRFRNFEDIGGFYDYLKKNKKKDIVYYDVRGYLVFKVVTEEGQEEIQAINLIKFQEIEQEQVENIPTNCPNFNNNMEGAKCIEQLKKKLRKLKKTIKNAEKKLKVNSHREIIFTLANKQNQFQVNDQYPIFQFPLKISDLASEPFKIKLRTVISDKVIFGIKFTLRQSEAKSKQIQHYIVFKKSFECSYPIQDGNSLQISLQQGDFVIKNVNNQTGLKFQDCLGEQHMEVQCCAFITIKQSSI